MKVITEDAATTAAPGAAASGLEAIARDAEQLENAATQQEVEGQGAPPEEKPLSNADVLAGGLAGARDVFCMFTGFESPKTTMGPEQVQTVANAWGAALDGRGISLQDKMGGYALEIAAAVATIPVAYATVAGVRAEMEAREKIAKAVPKGAPSAPLPAPAPGVIKPAFANG